LTKVPISDDIHETRLGRFLRRLPRYAGVIHYAAGKHPALFYPLYYLRGGRGSRLPVRRNTELVLEGFPRSGNSFALLAFRLAQGREVITADHLHVPAQVKRAALYGIPACVLIREPEDMVRSLVVKHSFIRPKDALRGYLGFYRACLPYRDRFVVASFEQVTTDYGAIIDRINTRFGTSFVRFENHEANVLRVFEALDKRNRWLRGDDLTVARPNGIKVAAKQHVDLSDCAALLARCRTIYRRYEALYAEPPAFKVRSFIVSPIVLTKTGNR
jgi:hypothetical protein